MSIGGRSCWSKYLLTNLDCSTPQGCREMFCYGGTSKTRLPWQRCLPHEARKLHNFQIAQKENITEAQLAKKTTSIDKVFRSSPQGKQRVWGGFPHTHILNGWLRLRLNTPLPILLLSGTQGENEAINQMCFICSLKVIPEVSVSAVVLAIVDPAMLVALTEMVYVLSSLRLIRVCDLMEPSEMVTAPC